MGVFFGGSCCCKYLSPPPSGLRTTPGEPEGGWTRVSCDRFFASPDTGKSIQHLTKEDEEEYKTQHLHELRPNSTLSQSPDGTSRDVLVLHRANKSGSVSTVPRINVHRNTSETHTQRAEPHVPRPSPICPDNWGLFCPSRRVI
ncbi:hypothetical protein DPEC_G00115240 [Dallia pectoralis]|uniref:Uncharacterized protein n=1 Tax=Dallia pectoralis TaxID=75939 RepID=A0ACC2GUB6_DALPE|nr:hypothetical protein DPEC_G00115240 [Dallia pectoralis]